MSMYSIVSNTAKSNGFFCFIVDFSAKNAIFYTFSSYLPFYFPLRCFPGIPEHLAADEKEEHSVAQCDQAPGKGVGNDQTAQRFILGKDRTHPENTQSASAEDRGDRRIERVSQSPQSPGDRI